MLCYIFDPFVPLKKSTPHAFTGTDRVLRPMILTKQLEPRETNSAPQATPRENLAKELEKYNRPEASSKFNVEMKKEPQAEASTSEPPASKPEKVKSLSTALFNHAPRRPNILSKRPHMQSKKLGMLNGSSGNKIIDAYNVLRSASPSSTSSGSSIFAPSPKPVGLPASNG